MEKRVILAIALSVLVLFSWSAFVSKTQPTGNKEVIVSSPSAIMVPAPQTTPVNIAIEQTLPPSPIFPFTQEKSEINFNEYSAMIESVIFKDYQAHKFPLKYGFFIKDKNLHFKKTDLSGTSVTFTHADDDKQIIKRFIFSKSQYSIELEIEVRNLSTKPLTINLPLVLGALDFNASNPDMRLQDITGATKEKVLHPNVHRDTVLNEIVFLGLRDRYFCAIVEPTGDHYTGWVSKIDNISSELGIGPKELIIAPGQVDLQKFRIYLGPQDLKLIGQIKPEWQAVMYFGMFDFISRLLLQLLDFLYSLVHNWGVALILLSVGIYLLLFPLSLKQMRGMKQMQALQPVIEELRQTYKDNPQRLNKEIMELYRKNKVNPFSGCLPLVLQMPIFFALYQALLRSIALKGAHFWWIKDLSQPDRLFILPRSLPILGNEINLLPILMTIGMFVQQKTSMAQTSGTSAEQQKIMLILFPLMFGLIFYRMPAGLVLYWFINSLLMLAYQLKINRTNAR